MRRVAFWFDAPFEYTGGLNYLRNLLHALARVNDGSVQPVVFFAANLPAGIEAQFAPLATVVRTRLLQRKTLPWFVHKVGFRLLRAMPLVYRLLRRHRIDLLSHAWIEFTGRAPCPILTWVPDFQYLHLPELFPGLDPEAETRSVRAMIAQARLVILSSQAAHRDFLAVAPPGHEGRGRVLPFVSQPHGGEVPPLAEAERRLGFRGPFFVLPNQFWAHKNHHVVVDAVAALKAEGLAVQVLCTGNTRDYRLGGTPYVDSLRERIAAQGLRDQVRILGLIDYADLLCLLRHCVGVINPSRFEGWSSSVEEGKSHGKPVILSNIDVHLEQAPARGHYFDPDDAGALAQALRAVWEAHDPAADARHARAAHEDLARRTEAFGRAYLALVDEALPR